MRVFYPDLQAATREIMELLAMGKQSMYGVTSQA